MSTPPTDPGQPWQSAPQGGGSPSPWQPGYPQAEPSGWPYPGQSPQQQPYPGQPYPGRPYPGQPYPGQSYPGQGYPGQPPQWHHPQVPVDLPMPAGEGMVYWPGRGSVAIPHMGRRLLARLVDLVIVFAAISLVGGLLGGVVGTFADPSGEPPAAVIGVVVSLIIVLCLGGPILYEVGLIAKRGATLGKALLGIRVVRAEDAQLLSWGRSAGRFFLPLAAFILPIISLLFALLCYLSPFFDSTGRRQGWHDRASRSIAIYPRSS